MLTNSEKEALKHATFHGGSRISETAYWVRRVGRPRHNWTEQLLAVMVQKAGGQAAMEKSLRDGTWKKLIVKKLRDFTCQCAL